MNGIITLLPVLLLLVVAVVTKKTTSSLIIGAIVAFILMGGKDFVYNAIDGIYAVGTDYDTVWILVILILIGVVVGLLTETGASEALLFFIGKRASSERSLFLWSWGLVVVLFIDDMVRNTVLGQMSPLYDKYKIPRASLAYMADATGTALAALIPITSWAVFYQGVFGSYEELSYLGSPLQIYIKTLPFMFYGWLTIIIAFLFTMNWFPKLGAMKTAHRIAKETGKLYSDRSIEFNKIDDKLETDENGVPIGEISLPILRISCFVGTVIVLTIVVIKVGDLMFGLIIASILLLIISLITKLSTWDKLLRSAFKGAESMLPMVLICFCAYLMRDAVVNIGMTDYIIGLAGNFITPALFPAISFILCCVLTFTTGSNWGITAIYATIGVPLGLAIGANPILLMAAIINGATFGAHICFYTDYTVFASMITKIDNIEHALTQLPYGLIAGGITTVLFIFAGYIMI